MKFKFDSNLEYQKEAIKSIVDLFKGQHNNHEDIPFVAENGVISNELNISTNHLLNNLNSIQRENRIKEIEKLEGIDFSVEMETGTGKTYVYLRSILELNKEYGLKKFIIIVPSVAIREGVLKTLEITKQHFKQIYDNVSYNFSEYDSKKLSRVRQFSRNNNVEILVMTLDSFNKDTNIMNQNIDKLNGQRPIDLVSKTRPILILDEPQNMESDKSKEALIKLTPLLRLRYSATHKNYYNLVYRLTPVDAYTKGLVKKIEVLSVVKEDDFNSAYIKCLEIRANEKGINAKLEVNKRQKTGYKKKIIVVDIKKNRDIFKKTENSEYDGFIVSTIDAQYNYVKFSNGITVKFKESLGGDKSEIMRVQIKHTIEEHFRKQDLLKPLGLKVLSLFFIDKVVNYKEEQGIIRKIFVEEFERIKKGFPNFCDLDVDKVHRGYFSNYKNERSMETDKDTFDLIMKDKERLLSFDEPTQFIFSHSALREGWDNPNVFNICTLNESVSEMKKRQEIGRGVRLPVNQNGERLTDLKENILTVIANESYAEYVSKLQQEYRDEYGELAVGIKPANAGSRKILKLKKGFSLNSDFKELWERISKKTKYNVNIDTSSLINDCAKQIDDMSIGNIKIRSEKVSLVLKENEEIGCKFVGEEFEESSVGYEIPNLIEKIAVDTMLTRETIYIILSKVNSLGLIFENPQEFIEGVSDIIYRALKKFLVDGIEYVEIRDFWRMELFKDLDSYIEHIVPDSDDKTIYEGIIGDSEGEKEFARKLEKDDRIKMFIKLPSWFVVKTPIGEYNPDWAIVREERDFSRKISEKLYLIRETKFVNDLDNLRPSEKFKIDCARKHFGALNVDFKEVKSFEEMI